MKQLLTILLCAVGIFSLDAQTPEKSNREEKVVKAYFEGWVKKDWNQVAAQLTDEFTFTSPAPDDHINLKQFKEKC